MFAARLLSQEKYEKRLTGTASRLVDGAYHGEAIKNAPHVVVGSCAADRHLVTISQAVIYRLCKLFLNAPLINTLELAFEAESAQVHCCSIDTKPSRGFVLPGEVSHP